MQKNSVPMTEMGKMHRLGETEALTGLMQNVVLYLHLINLLVAISGRKA